MAEIQPYPQIVALVGPPPAGLNLREDNYFIYNVVACVFFGLAVVAVMLRVYVRMTRGASLAMDDHTIVAAIFTAGTTLFMTLYAAKVGSGQHIWAINPADLVILLKMVYAEPWVYATAVTVTRVSILLLYHRLFDTNTTSNMVYVWQTRVAIAFTAAYPLVMYIVMAVACRPLSFYWTKYLGETNGVCIDVMGFYLAFGVLNMINDLIILVLPIPTIAKLHMDWRKKLSIMAIMLLGCFWTCRGGSGPAWGGPLIEPSVAIITACLPTLAPLFRKSKPANAASYNFSEPRFKPSQRTDCAAERGEQWTKIDDDDEIELTRNGQRASSYSPSGKTDPDVHHDGGVITVSTQVDVSSSHSQVDTQPWKDKSAW
ncbi:hypothetical protein PG994_004059 [Apiospora phragmitis]|uniref:Rhodopsin domain-containing protein n=1 Tax=Apiospora phragmitis TaxID=2905665 RepID=A0ABR1VZV8_9PEZI